ncbi:MAG: MATE family efflux transporter [Clostridiales Family XIII bacterium]|jgi:putative MATE family efflux protein|nr:MATE family efflux transporter [Clostridiales Family XIII bacterium]
MGNKRTASRKKNLLNYTVPSIIAMCGTFLYIVVDGIFVGRGVGMDALGAVNMAMPFILFVDALCTLMTVGGITITAIRLGRGDKRGANDAFRHATLLALFAAMILTIVSISFPRKIAMLLGANITFFEMTSDYIFYSAMFFLPLTLSYILQGFVRNDGSPKLVGIAVIVGACTNVFLDWLFIFPLQMGVKGAALATGAGEVLVVAILMTHFARRKGVLRLGKAAFSWTLIGKIFKRGLPEMLFQLGTPITTFCMNRILIDALGDMSVSAFSVISYLFSFVMGIFLGVSEGLQPLIGQNYGRKDANEMKFYFRSGIIINFFASGAVYSLLLIFGVRIYSLFGSEPVLINTVADALPKFGWGFMLIASNLMIGSYLYSTKRTAQALILASCRCIVLNSALILLLPRLFAPEIVWYSLGIAELISFIIAVILLRYSERNGVVFR